VFLIDLDHFKAVNDLHGHDTGDVYLREIATRMAASVPEGWVVSRLGGDEFAVCGNTTVPLSLAIQTGHRLIERIAEPLVIGTDTFRPGCSIGLSSGPHHATSGRDLMAYADHALLAAKATGRGKLGLFDAAGKQAIADAAKEGRLLSEALASDTVFMQYQPQIDMSTGRVVGAEALVRWQHPQGHVVQPMQLFGLAEDSGLLSILCKHILKRLAADMHALHTEFGCLPRIGLNLHPTQIKNLFSLLQELEVVASPSGDNGHLVLEISENALVGRGTEDIPLVLSGLRDMGFELSLDDFGTGLASLTHLRDLPFTEVKLSQSVIARLPDDGEEYAMVEGIYDLARKKGMRVVAEGVETARQEQLLNKLGPMTAQGFYYHAPMSCSAFAIFLSSAKLSVSVRPTLLDSPVSETGYFESFSTKDAA
jgi:diguanylate cyclase (GGDEF)-like protein